MKNVIKNIYQVVSIIVILVGFAFSYLIAELNDAPGFVIIGGIITISGAMFLYGLGEFINEMQKSNKLLLEIHKELVDKNK